MDNACRILIVDDDKNIRKSLQISLQNRGHIIHLAQDAQQALQMLQANVYDILVLDVVLGDLSGVDLFSRLKAHSPDLPVIFMSGAASLSEVAKLMKLGAADFLEKPFTDDKLILAIDKCFKLISLQNKINYFEKVYGTQKDQIIGQSKAIKETKELISRVAGTNAHVLITGKSGTGKELVAKQLHLQSKRASESFIKINCSAIPENLVESELFGHEKGAFTGAISNKAGYFELANNGTLFLDEIGEMSLSAQAKILRALQNGEIQSVGSAQVKKVNVRLIAATHKDLKTEVQNGRFREDLFFRINVIPISLPPLRDRSTDIEILAQKFLEDISIENAYNKRSFSQEALDILSKHSWPGNIRELRNFIERLLIVGGGEIFPEEFESSFLTLDNKLALTNGNLFNSENNSAHGSLKEYKDKTEREYIVNTLKKFSGNITQSANLLDIERTYLHRRINYFKIDKKEYL